MSLKQTKTIAILLLLIGAILALWGVNYPFVGLYNANNNFLSLASKNYLRFGFDTLKFLPTYFSGEHLPNPPEYYLHHPTLMFLLSAIAVKFLGTSNWAIHVVPFLFVLGSVFFIYRIGKMVWGKKVGILSAGLALIFPMTTFFWKMMFFEQISLFFALGIFYFCLLYLSSPRKIFLIIVFVLSLLGGLADWGAGYLLFPFVFWLFWEKDRNALRVFLCYLAGIFLGFVLFLINVFVIKGNFQDLLAAILLRSVDKELFGLEFWWLKLSLITLLRIFIYFTPVSFISLIYLFFRKKRFLNNNLSLFTLLFFLIYGCLNIFVLPTATWGHSYFLYYLIPFFAFLNALLLAKIVKSGGFLWGTILILIASSAAVNYFKNKQIENVLWKYAVAEKINQRLLPYETVAVNNFPGEILQNYFFHPIIDIPFGDIQGWLLGDNFKEVRLLLLPCESLECPTGERQIIRIALQTGGKIFTYESNGHKLLLIKKKNEAGYDNTILLPDFIFTERPRTVSNDSVIMKIYHFFKNSLSAGQI